MRATMATLVASLLPFAVSMSFTPGPNNLMMANAGARFGFVRSMPHQAGIVVGFAAMNLLVGFGVAGLITAVPGLYTVMKYASIAYLLYLAWRIAVADASKAGIEASKPMSFVQAALFQWVNPKAWIITLGAVTTYTSLQVDLRLQILVITLIFAVVGLASTTTWALFGQLIRRYLTTVRRRVIFNLSMAVLLAASIVPVLLEK